MKRECYLLVGFIMTMFFVIPKANAQVVNFSIETMRNSWFTSDLGSSINDTNKYSGINWQKTSSKTSHRMWFRVLNSNGVVKGQLLFDFPKTDVIETNLVSQEQAYLQGRRENVGDPSTVVSGIWTA